MLYCCAEQQLHERCHLCYSQRKELEDSQQSSHKEQVDALWSRLEAASEAHKQQVQQLQEKQQELVMQLEHCDAECSQVSICFRIHKSSSRHTMRTQAAAVKAKDAGLTRNKDWWHTYRACRSCWLLLLNEGVPYTC